MFQNKFYEESRKEVMKKGFRFSHTQHNGNIFATLTGDGLLLRKLVSLNGKVNTYKPRKATKREKQLYSIN